MPREKFCETCGKELIRREKENEIRFFLRKYCDKKCSKAGHQKMLDRRLKKSKGRHKDG